MQSSEIVQRAIDYIEHRLTESLTLEEIAGVAAMSLPNLYRLFHSLTGHPIKEYIRKRRINEAAICLRDTDLPTIDIGYRCGFESYPTFIKTFKRLTGLTPGQYRRSQLVYSFERMNLNEHVCYLEERQLSERFPEVRVIRLNPQQGIGHLFVSEFENGIETAAIDHFRERLTSHRVDLNGLRLFGWNVDMEDETKPFGYQLLAVDLMNQAENLKHRELYSMTLNGGLYAVARTPSVAEDSIQNTWNRLFSEWLPRSVFEQGKHEFIEEYVLNQDQIVRMKLYLPVERSKLVKRIEIVELSSLKVMRFRRTGVDCVKQADEDSISWLCRNGLIDDSRIRVFMHCDGGLLDENPTYEVYIAPPKEFLPSREEVDLQVELEGGRYACLESGAYGTMTGVLERVDRWLDMSTEYRPDPARSWYASYLPKEEVDDGIINVKCYVPVQIMS
ncbi:helix-turn-helix domain-containing protein [Paenibacillus lautus]|uniref:helix-turn-helix domain-containing protein n=1 Tax=Paenibacillus lautus TaxID=1401 RepID=UPI002DB77E7B|nr:helix-turn-helix domain-containing protein [Paenibacillus lautus]MEC0259008.1 helix-turn-helix domain-containing protein [Paenibacillus lautus]